MIPPPDNPQPQPAPNSHPRIFHTAGRKVKNLESEHPMTLGFWRVLICPDADEKNWDYWISIPYNVGPPR